MEFKLHSKFKPTGDQPNAINELVDGIRNNEKCQTLLGVTGSGKTFTIANIIEKVQKPTIIMAHNKTLAGQLYSEFKEFFPENAVGYFISYYDYYQPEVYMAHTDTYIEKETMINEEIDKMRYSATCSLIERKDVIIIASVSCIYGLGDPEEYKRLICSLRVGMKKSRDKMMQELIVMQYTRSDTEFLRGQFRVKGDIIDIYPVEETDKAIRIEFWEDEIEKISEIHPLTGKVLSRREHIAIYPKSHYVTGKEKIMDALGNIESELDERVEELKGQGKNIEAYRIEQRTNFDMEMMRETGFCQGIENYSRHISNRKAGDPPFTLLDFFPKDYLLIVDESHATIPQVRAMYNGDRARKEALVEYGFRLPSAYDNRPLKFEEWEKKINQTIFVSATPSDYEKEHSSTIAEQIIRPTGLLDPVIEVRPKDGQIERLIGEINIRVAKNERVLVTTLTKKMAEEFTDYLGSQNIKVRYMHSDIEALDRLDILRDLRLGKFDVLVGINLLREGLDLPEVSLVAIMDADKEGFLRSERSLIQTIGRAARNSEGIVIMYADELTDSMSKAISETNRRRKIQIEYNEKNNIVPTTIIKDIRDSIKAIVEEKLNIKEKGKQGETTEELVERLTIQMLEAAEKYEFEKAADLRDYIKQLVD